jgi:hypothetical protein
VTSKEYQQMEIRDSRRLTENLKKTGTFGQGRDRIQTVMRPVQDDITS